MKNQLLLFLCLLGATISHSQTFNDGVLNYTITDAIKKTVSVGKIGGACPTGDIVIPESVIDNGIAYTVTALVSSAFNGCTALTRVSIPNGVTEISSYSFNGCSNLLSINIPVGVTSIGSYAFNDCMNLTSISVPDSVEELGASAFFNCVKLKSVRLSKNITSIENMTFAGCKQLSSITVPNSVTSIGDFSFFMCSDLKNMTFPNNLATIGTNAFYRVGLTSINLPKSLTALEENAFFECKNLTTVTVNWVTPLIINGDVFKNLVLSDISLTVPSGTKAAYKAAPVWQAFDFEVLSTPDAELASAIRLYPNTKTGVLEIERHDFYLLKTVSIYNNLGQLMSEENRTHIDISNYSKGIYFADIITNKGKVTKKFIIQ